MPREMMIAFACIIGYLIGSFSGGIIISKLNNGPDLHTVGSKSTGASNVQRTMGWKFGIFTFFFDAVKGLLACFVAEWMTGSHPAALLAGLCCVIGHNWPLFFRFRGGKGVATTGAVMLYCFPFPAIACIVLTIAVIAVFRYISVGSMLMVISFFVWSFFFSAGEQDQICIIIWAAILMIMCVTRHHANIERLFHGTENKLGKKVK